MLTRLIASSYAWLLEASLWLSLALAGIAGYFATIPIIQALGGAPYPELIWQILGAFTFIVVGFLLLAVVTGPFLILMDVRHAVRSIETNMVNHEGREVVREIGRREPTI